MDQFANIAAAYQVDQARGLVEPQPPERDGRILPVSMGGTGFDIPKKIDSEEKLQQALQEARKTYAPFLEELAPKMPQTEQVTELKHFTYSLNGALPQQITVPHYQGPLGNQRAVYETDFSLTEWGADERVYIHCFGVDYIAEVSVNGSFAGRHEGFFAPFAFDVTDYVKPGENHLAIVVKNDYIMGGNDSDQGYSLGNKIYAATGPGWDDPLVGWHHCPPGMGIYQKVQVEVRPAVHITDLFPRIAGEELWVECYSDRIGSLPVEFSISLYGQNFQETVFEGVRMTPETHIEAGVGDTLTRARLLAEGKLGAGTPLLLEHGENTFVLPFSIPNPRVWWPETPWLYQVQVALLIDGKTVSTRQCQFGWRTFTQDRESVPKGKFYLNGEEIRLRGANTMGFEQQDVMAGDTDQLRDDILLAKLCNMNFLRITQRPVQPEIYEMCDRLGMMVQTDLPMFGCLRRSQYCEALRQVGEMERLVRSHPCCILDSYINEPFPNAKNMPHCMVTRAQLMQFFRAADDIVHMHNPDRVVKHVDGDYDPPSETLPDNHCYTLWYNGHGIDAGKLHKGYWLEVKPGWHYGCGEFGAEGLDSVDLMRRRYPAEWIQEPFDPVNIVRAQTAPFHYCFYETPHSMEEWVSESRRHQAFAVRLMTSAMRRDPNINTFAIHLFIDAFPSGWMKTIMDCERKPKDAFFAYLDCLEPVFCNLRSDRLTFFGGETASIEAFLCCDRERPPVLRYYAELEGKVIVQGTAESRGDVYQGLLSVPLPQVSNRSRLTVTLGAFTNEGECVHTAQETFTVFPAMEQRMPALLTWEEYQAHREEVDRAVSEGKTVVFAPLPHGEYNIGGKQIRATDCRMHPLYTVSRDTGHPLVEGFHANDFGWWYDERCDRLAPLLYTTLETEGTEAVLTTGNQDEDGVWRTKGACVQWRHGSGTFLLCQVELEGKGRNPVAAEFSCRLAALTDK